MGYRTSSVAECIRQALCEFGWTTVDGEFSLSVADEAAPNRSPPYWLTSDSGSDDRG